MELSYPEGFLRKTNKAALGRELENNVSPAESIPTPNACIIDGMAVVNKIQGDKKTFREGYHSKRIDVVFDVYRDISITNIERSIRASQGEGYSNRNKSCLVAEFFKKLI
jgi:hypothetical protein